MHRSVLGLVTVGGVLAISSALLVGGCGGSSSGGTPGSGGSTAAATGGATAATGGTTAATGGNTAPGTGGTVAATTGGNTQGGTSTGGVPASSGGAGTSSGGAAGGATGAGTGGGAGASGTGSGGTVPKGGAGGPASSGGLGGSASPPAGGDVGTLGDGDFTVAPPYAPKAQVMNVPHSSTFQFMMTSMIYPGAARAITVYIPKQYVDGTDAPFMIVTDGNPPMSGLPEIVTAAENHYQDTDLTTRIPPIVFVFVPPGADRSGEYDTVSDAYTRFIDTEVLPLVSSNTAIKAMYPGFKLTANPDGRAAYGCSSGSPAAMGLGWFGDFNRIISYSGTFVALKATTDHPLGAWEYPMMILSTMPPKPLRIFLEVGEMDNGYMTDAAGHRNWVIGNQNMAAALKMMGYHYRFLFAMGAGHCDGAVKSGTYSQTLAWAWRGYTGP